MKKFAIRFLSLLVVLSMMASVAGCSAIKEKFGDKESERTVRHKDKDDDDDEDDDDDDDDDDPVETTETTESEPEPEPSLEPTVMPANDKLIFPNEPYSYDKVHPYHEPGNITGDEAKEELSNIELDYIKESLQDDYVDIVILFDDYEAYGLTAENPSWGDTDIDPEGDLEMAQSYIDRLYEIDYESLDEEDRIFYDKFLYDLEESKYLAQYPGFNYLTPVFNALTSSQCDILFILDVLSFETTEDAENYIKLLIDTDRYYDDLCAFEEERVEYGYGLTSDAYENIALTFDSLVEQTDDCFLYDSFAERLDAIDGITEDEKAALIEEHEAAMKDYFFPEFQECADRMRALKGKGSNDSGIAAFDGGKDLYAAITRSLTNSQITPEEAAERVDAALVDCFNVYLEAASSGSAGLQHDYTAGDIQQNLDYLYGKIFEYFPEIPEHKYVFKEVPEVFADSFSPAAYLGYHLDTYDSNMILVNSSKAEGDLGATLAHEGYPGHMYQSVYTRSVATHPYMSIVGSTGYKEGWAQYVQVKAATLFFDASEEEAKVYEAETLLDLYLMTRIDIGVGYEGWTKEEAAQYINDLLGFPLISADTIADAYELVAVDPGYSVKYGVGYILTVDTFDKIAELDPDLSLKDIHKLYLDAQTGTFEQIYETVKRELGK